MVSLCVGKLGLGLFARKVKVPLVSSYSGGKCWLSNMPFAL